MPYYPKNTLSPSTIGPNFANNLMREASPVVYDRSALQNATELNQIKENWRNNTSEDQTFHFLSVPTFKDMGTKRNNNSERSGFLWKMYQTSRLSKD